jgi:hemerythrin-like metal-binding protein
MDIITWSESLSVGVDAFNKEHQQLISLINELNNALLIGSSAKTMENTLARLAKYTEIHFNHEEEYMRLHDYPSYEGHRKEHEELKKQVADYYEQLKSGRKSFSLSLLNFLKDWLTNHILGTDMKYKDFFAKKGL